ncbi:MAG: ATP-binding cassette domain-containing protein, partial [Candidatus Aenigmatarchaeota archaeon]
MEERKILLRTEKIRMEFGGLLALKDVDVDIYEGELISLIGPNGAGKTTLLNIISGIYRPTRGKVIFEGNDITNTPPENIAYRRITRTFQIPQLFTNMTVLENVMVGFHTKINRSMLGCLFTFPWFRKEEKWVIERSTEFLEFVGLRDKAHLSVTALPYGDRKKLELARALALEP